MMWDWYSATVESQPDQVLRALLGGQDLSSVYPCRGLYSYERGMEVRRGDRVFAKCFWGGVNGVESTHVQASGLDTPYTVGVIRQEWPQHRVSRADVREDWSHPRAWRRLVKIALAVAADFNVKTSTVGDWIRGQEGRTLYLGSMTSRVVVRIYEKGKQLGVDPNWVRMEIVVRPTGEGKSELAAALPAQVMQSTRWTAELARRVGIPEFDSIRVRDPWSQSDDERALSYCFQQYGKILQRKAEALGGWSELGAHIGAAVEAAQETKQ